MEKRKHFNPIESVDSILSETQEHLVYIFPDARVSYGLKGITQGNEMVRVDGAVIDFSIYRDNRLFNINEFMSIELILNTNRQLYRYFANNIFKELFDDFIQRTPPDSLLTHEEKVVKFSKLLLFIFPFSKTLTQYVADLDRCIVEFTLLFNNRILYDKVNFHVGEVFMDDLGQWRLFEYAMGIFSTIMDRMLQGKYYVSTKEC